MSQVPRTLLLNHSPIEITDAGEIFLRTLASHYPQGRLCRFALTPRGSAWTAAEWLGFPIATTGAVDQRRRRRFGESVGGLASFTLSAYASTLHTRAVIDQAVGFARAHNVEQVWAVLNAPQVIYVARRVAEALSVPLVVTVWDPPERFVDALGMDALSGSHVLSEFAKAILAARRVTVASEGMRNEYYRRYAIHSRVLIQGIDASWVHPPAQGLADPQHVTIGYAGSMYAFNELLAFVAALSSCGWRLGGRRVRLRVLGRSLEMSSSSGVNIEWLGWRPMLDVIKQLSQVDLCYVPYWMDGAHSLAARTCFPNKIATYLAAGRPLFVHAPTDSSPAEFARRYQVGLTCASLEADRIIGSLESLASSEESYALLAQACTTAIAAELSMSVFHARFAELMGVDVRDLTPVGAVRVSDLV